VQIYLKEIEIKNFHISINKVIFAVLIYIYDRMIFDMAIAVILLWGAYKGFTKGFVIQIASFAALILGIWGAYHFSGYTSDVIFKHSDNQYIPIISFAITFVAIIILIHLLARMLTKVIKSISMNIFNRLIGGVFGIALYAFIISVLLIIVNRVDQEFSFLPEEEINKSVLYTPLSQFAPKMFPYLKFNELRESLEKKKDIKEKEQQNKNQEQNKQKVNI
jgi:membrane protein required for colicin V production